MPPGNSAALAERLAFLQARPVLTGALGRAGMAPALWLFTWQRVADGLVEVYRCAAKPGAKHFRAVWPTALHWSREGASGTVQVALELLLRVRGWPVAGNSLGSDGSLMALAPGGSAQSAP